MVSSRSRPCDEATIRATLATGDCAAAAKPWVLLVSILASSISYIDESVVNVALPAIETDLGASVVVIQWLVNAYTLKLSAFLLLGGSAGDLFGRRRIFIAGLAIFAAASLWCGFSPAREVVHPTAWLPFCREFGRNPSRSCCLAGNCRCGGISYAPMA